MFSDFLSQKKVYGFKLFSETYYSPTTAAD